VVPRELTLFTFRVEDEQHQPVTDLDLYMGMPGHAVFLRRDHGVFAHVHPGGSAAMAATEIAEQAVTGDTADHRGHTMMAANSGASHAGAIPAVVTFPYGLPGPGKYRVFVQVKRAGRIETAVFDLTVPD